ncbi:MAG: hypothetical protein R3F65_10250 [bacterium]|nr:hypothetical protein [Myxococcales bacterium]MCB9543176.1 hypothetical protein [Myxococcales bacterium]
MTTLALICAVVAIVAATARLDRIARLEAEDAPDRVDRWASETEALAAALTGPTAATAQTELLRWLQDRLGLGPARRHERPEITRRRDALHDIIADAPRLADALTRFADAARHKAAAHGPAIPLNLLALLRTKVNWRANDLHKSTERRHTRHLRPLDDADEPAPPAVDPALARVLIAQITRRFADDDVLAVVLPLKFAGEADADIARQTGHSRSKVQRALIRFRRWLGEGAA